MTLYALAAVAGVAAVVAFMVALGWCYRRFYVTVKPDEFVVHYGRGGRVKHLGRGVSFFCWPGETFLVVPSTIRDINFCADQITREKQGVRVQGFLAYRINDFERAYQTLDLRSRMSKVLMSAETNVEHTDYETKNRETIIKLDPNDPLAKTDLMLRRLAESVVRHEVSNKTVEEMIGERETVIESMKEQIGPSLERWGLVVETIEFTEVWIRSKQLFECLQASYRNQMKLEAERSSATTNQQIAQHKLESEREVARLNAETERARRVSVSNEQLAARDVEIKNQEQVRERELTLEQKLAEKQIENESRRVSLVATREAEQQRRADEAAQQAAILQKEHELARQQESHKLAVDRRLKEEELRQKEAETARLLMELQKKAEIEQTELERQRAEVSLRQTLEAEQQSLEVARLQTEQEAARVVKMSEALASKGAVEAQIEQLRVEARNHVNGNQLQGLFIQQLAGLAGAMKVGEVNWINMAGGADGRSPLGIVPESILQLVTLLRGMGIELDRLLPGAAKPAGADAPAAAPAGVPAAVPAAANAEGPAVKA